MLALTQRQLIHLPQLPRACYRTITQSVSRTMAAPNINHYDAIVIGSGQAGTPLAAALQKAGKKTAMIESTHIGGCCVNEGCTPTKTMITSGRIAYLARRAAKDYGVHVGEGSSGVKVDMQKVRQRKRDIVKSFREGSERKMKNFGVEVLMGTAEFTTEKELTVKLND